MVGTGRHEWEAEITPQRISVEALNFLPLGDAGFALRILGGCQVGLDPGGAVPGYQLPVDAEGCQGKQTMQGCSRGTALLTPVSPPLLPWLSSVHLHFGVYHRLM